MKILRRLIPSMFQRRLSLLLLVFMVTMLLLWGQLFRLTVVQGAELLEEAEMKMVDVKLLPTKRGDILDRKGRVLATDTATYDIRATYDLITGQWAHAEAYKHAKADHKKEWAELSAARRDQLRDELVPLYNKRLDELWDELCEIGGIPRAELDQRRAAIVEHVHELRAHLWGVWHQERLRKAKDPVDLADVAQDIREMHIAHTLIESVSDEVAFKARNTAKILEFGGISVDRSKLREYPCRQMSVVLQRNHLPGPLASDVPFETEVQELAMNLVGEMRDVWAEDVNRRPYRVSYTQRDLGGYLPGDRVGSTGVEAAEEDHLRGLRGMVLTHRDTGNVERTMQAEGKDLQMSIDLMLQARVRAILDPAFGLMRSRPWHGNDEMIEGTPLFGAAIVMEVDSGEILAMVSTPVAMKNDPDLMLDPNRPMENKAISAVYPPGSTLKPIIYAIASAKGKIDAAHPFLCEGYLDPNNTSHLRCWIYREPYYGRHDLLGPVEAIARSCNIYFYRCGRAISPRLLVESLHEYGFDEPLDLGVPGAVTGMLPSLTGPNPADLDLTIPNATQIGIGQGPIAVPPIQVAAAHAALAREGFYLSPTLIHNDQMNRVSRDLKLPPRVRQFVLRGMYESANNSDYGTAHHVTIEGNRIPLIDFPGIGTLAKTGTATPPPQYPLKRITDSNGQEMIVADKSKRPLRKGNHGWFVLHVTKPGEQRASYVITVIVEYGGSGGRVAGPVANQILYAMQAEGYL